MEEEEKEEAEGRDMHQVPGIWDKVMSRQGLPTTQPAYQLKSEKLA